MNSFTMDPADYPSSAGSFFRLQEPNREPTNGRLF